MDVIGMRNIVGGEGEAIKVGFSPAKLAPIRIPITCRQPMEVTIAFAKHMLEQSYAECLERNPHATPKELREEHNAVLRGLVENDLFLFIYLVLKRTDLAKPWLYDRCREFQLNPNEHIDLWAREHYKSTIITFAGTLFDIIANPEITIGIFSHTKPVARKFLGQIKYELESNPLFHELWPDIFWQNPQKESPKWSEDSGILVKRRSNPKEMTIEASGLVDGQPTGRHYALRVYDDVVTVESVSTPEQIEKTTRGYEMSDNLGTVGGTFRIIGTRYHLFDTYRSIMDRGAAKVRIYPATDDGSVTGKPVLMSQEVLNAKMATQGVYTFSCQMLQNPVADASMGFKMQWLRYGEVLYENAMNDLFRVLICDPAGSKQRKNNDYTSMWVLGYGADRIWRVLDGIRDRINLTDRAALYIALHRKWKPHRAGYEAVGMQADIEYIREAQRQQTYDFPIIELKAIQSKKARIDGLVPYFQNERIIFPPSIMYKNYTGHVQNLIKVFLEEEYTAYPVPHHDDMLDCLARIADPALMVNEPIDTRTPQVREFNLERALAERAMKSSVEQFGVDNSWMAR
jgi:hypothetical protein